MEKKDFAKMGNAEIRKVAEFIASNCTTCKKVAEHFSALVEKYGKENAIQIQGVAKGIVKDNLTSKKTDTENAIGFLKSNKVAKIALKMYLKDNNNEFVDILVNRVFGGDIDKLCKTYFTYVSESGEFINRKKVETANGFSYKYVVKNSDTANGYLSILKKSISNARFVACGGSLDKIHTIIANSEISE